MKHLASWAWSDNQHGIHLEHHQAQTREEAEQWVCLQITTLMGGYFDLIHGNDIYKEDGQTYDLAKLKKELDTYRFIDDGGMKYRFHISSEELTENEEIQRAKKTLERHGYFTENLWHIDDVKAYRNCDDGTAQEVLNSALTSEWVMTRINEQIEEKLHEQDE